MTELRWILLVAGVALIAGLYVMGVRSRRRSADAGVERTVRIEPRPAPPGEAPRIEPRVFPEVDEPPVAEPEPLVPLRDEPAQPIEHAFASRREPTLERPVVEPVPEPQPSPRAEPATGGPGAPKAQKIIALRVSAPLPSRFDGTLLHEAVLAEGFEFGRFEIFHRLDASGRPILSLASLLEPGTFDPATMAGASYPGVALFTVLPGPVPAPQALEELLDAGRALANRLEGSLLDDRGAALSVQRIARLREEMLEFEHARHAPPGG